MSRYEREQSPYGYYHVMQRGAGKQILFEDDSDYARYLRKMSEFKKASNVSIVAYCLMNNHVHLLVQADDIANLSSLMNKIGVSYAKWYNLKYDHAGYVFQGRFLSEPIHDESYLLACVRYIHNNPVKAGFGSRDTYRWSSYNEYFGTSKIANTELIEGLFQNKAQFIAFSASADDRPFIETENNYVACQIGQEIIRKHYGNDFANSLQVKQLCVDERNMIIKEMKNAGLNNRQIELLTGVSRTIVSRV